MRRAKRKRSKHSYCAFCRTPRIIYTKRHLSAGDAGLCFVSAVLFGVIIWQDFDPRTIVFFAIGLGLSELFIIFRWRLSIVCMHCGFDPVLYKKAPESAAKRVKRYLEVRRENPLLAFSPAPKLPVLIKPPVSDPGRNHRDTGAMR
jgi:hypothetical protein